MPKRITQAQFKREAVKNGLCYQFTEKYDLYSAKNWIDLIISRKSYKTERCSVVVTWNKLTRKKAPGKSSHLYLANSKIFEYKGFFIVCFHYPAHCGYPARDLSIVYMK